MKITVEESRSHLPPIKMQLVHFGSDEKSSISKSSASDGNTQQKGKDATAPINVKAMANEIKLEQERKKVL